MEDGTDLAVLIYLDVSQSRDIISRMAQKYNLFHEDEFYTDPTTKLPNINYMHQFGDEWVNSLRARKLSPVLMYFDVNSMQSYNNQPWRKAWKPRSSARFWRKSAAAWPRASCSTGPIPSIP